jgi:thiamine-monophosphate kinase
MSSVYVKDIGEFGLIESIAYWIRRGTEVSDEEPHDLQLSIGDDAAVWRADKALNVWTTDTMVAGIHFSLSFADWSSVGWKIIAVNMSDIAAMGATANYALVTLGLPEDTLVQDVEQLYIGMTDISNQEGIRIIGGDLVKSPVLFVTVSLIGTAQESVLMRSAAKDGDLVVTSGFPGLSAAGLRILSDGRQINSEYGTLLADAHLRPQARTTLGKSLLTSGVRAAIDTSDGLIADLKKLCSASQVAATIDWSLVPVHPALPILFPDDWSSLILNGGEEYELIFTATAPVLERLLSESSEKLNVIGQIIAGDPGAVTVTNSSFGEIDLTHTGWDHFLQ